MEATGGACFMKEGHKVGPHQDSLTALIQQPLPDSCVCRRHWHTPPHSLRYLSSRASSRRSGGSTRKFCHDLAHLLEVLGDAIDGPCASGSSNSWSAGCSSQV